MRKVIQSGMFILALCILWGMAAQSAEAAKKEKVKMTFKKGVLTLSGKGTVPANLKVKNKNKVKKVVIKKGITSISDRAFYKYKNLKNVQLPSTIKKIGCYSFSGTALESMVVPSGVKTIGQYAFWNKKKMKKLTLPGKFKVKELTGDDEAYLIAGKVETVGYSTRLELNTTEMVYADNMITCKDDPEYKSINGVIYSKDGKSLVRVPFGRKELVIEDGCEEFCLQSILYRVLNHYGMWEYSYLLNKIVIPASVKEIEVEKYPARNMRSALYEVSLDIRTKQLTDDSLLRLFNELDMTVEEIMQHFPDAVDYVEDMYITKGGALLAYTGKATKIQIPARVKKIANNVFSKHSTLKEVVLPEGLTEIGRRAFFLDEDDDKDVSLEVNLPSTLRRIGVSAFEGRHMKQLTLPPSVESYGESCFASNDFQTVILPDGIKVIPRYMFTRCMYLKQVVIPDSVEIINTRAFYSCWRLEQVDLGKGIKKVGEGAFSYTQGSLKKVIVRGSSKGISNLAFYADSIKIIYKKGAKEMKTPFDIESITLQKKKKQKVTMYWSIVVGADGYQLVIAKDIKLKKDKKTLNIKKSKNSCSIMIPVKGKKREPMYAKIRPYKIEKGKKVYGRWTTDFTNSAMDM